MSSPYKIPERINSIVIVGCTICYFGFMLLAAAQDSYWIKILYGIGFGIIMIPVYSLIHEAEHGILYHNRWWNQFLGRYLCCLYIAPFSFFRHCHLKHHKKNRTDEEIWDLYYEHQDKRLRYGNLYLMMMGIGYFMIWLSVIVFAFYPNLVNHKIFYSHHH